MTDANDKDHMSLPELTGSRPPSQAAVPADGPKTAKDPEAPRPRAKPRIPDVDEILSQIIHLNGAVILGAISPKDAAILHRNLKTVLDTQLKRSKPSEGHQNQEALVDLCRRDPRAISAVHTFLTEEQLQLLMEQIAET